MVFKASVQSVNNVGRLCLASGQKCPYHTLVSASEVDANLQMFTGDLQIYCATVPYNTVANWPSWGCSTTRNVWLKLMTLSQLNSAKWICGLSSTRWLGLNVGLYVKPAAMTWLIHDTIRLHQLVLVLIILIDVKLEAPNSTKVISAWQLNFQKHNDQFSHWQWCKCDIWT